MNGVSMTLFGLGLVILSVSIGLLMSPSMGGAIFGIGLMLAGALNL
jgi:hypothetical protein